MKKESATANAERASYRVTRARAALSRTSNENLPPKVPVQNQKRNLRSNIKRAASNENNSTTSDSECPQRKRRAVLKDVSNVVCQSSYKNCINAVKVQPKDDNKQFKRGKVKESKVVPSVVQETPQFQTNEEKKTVHGIEDSKHIKEETVSSGNVEENIPAQLSDESNIGDAKLAGFQISTQRYEMPSRLQRLLEQGKGGSCGKMKISSNPDVKDIDIDHTDPQLCSLYASEIHSNLRVAELTRRPSSNFMETIQSDVTDAMRGILVDWLVEVSEEYKLVPDTLYLAVYYIDLFLSQNRLERQRLQLLGITCMLIASKYEEICAPRVEEFCFITDNTYNRGEVLKMESEVLNFFCFHLSAPTTKTFLRRFLRAAQVTYKRPSLELEYLANYLAELTLMDYSFLNYLPSLIAASAVFVARWTLDQSSHPWSPTLEHYTTYMASDLETTAFALQELQSNTNGCPLHAIRAKYKQEKFKAVATLPSPKLLQTLFQ